MMLQASRSAHTETSSHEASSARHFPHLREPKTKSDLLDRILQLDFSGDFRDLAPERRVRIERLSPHVVALDFLDSGKIFQLVVRKQRPVRERKSRKQRTASTFHESVQEASARENVRFGRKARTGQLEEEAPKRKRGRPRKVA